MTRDRLVDWRQGLVSLLVVAISTLEVSEIAFRLEAFPLTHTGMFAEYEPPEKFPWAFTIEGWRHGRWRELRPWVFRLSPDTLIAKLGADFETLPRTCGTLADSLNRSRKPGLRMQRVRIRAEGRVRPQSGRENQTRLVECELERRRIEP